MLLIAVDLTDRTIGRRGGGFVQGGPSENHPHPEGLARALASPGTPAGALHQNGILRERDCPPESGQEYRCLTTGSGILKKGRSGMRPADWRVSLTDLVQADPRV